MICKVCKGKKSCDRPTFPKWYFKGQVFFHFPSLPFKWVTLSIIPETLLMKNWSLWISHKSITWKSANYHALAYISPGQGQWQFIRFKSSCSNGEALRDKSIIKKLWLFFLLVFAEISSWAPFILADGVSWIFFFHKIYWLDQ